MSKIQLLELLEKLERTYNTPIIQRLPDKGTKLKEKIKEVHVALHTIEQREQNQQNLLDKIEIKEKNVEVKEKNMPKLAPKLKNIKQQDKSKGAKATNNAKTTKTKTKSSKNVNMTTRKHLLNLNPKSTDPSSRKETRKTKANREKFANSQRPVAIEEKDELVETVAEQPSMLEQKLNSPTEHDTSVESMMEVLPEDIEMKVELSEQESSVQMPESSACVESERTLTPEVQVTEQNDEISQIPENLTSFSLEIESPLPVEENLESVNSGNLEQPDIGIELIPVLTAQELDLEEFPEEASQGVESEDLVQDLEDLELESTVSVEEDSVCSIEEIGDLEEVQELEDLEQVQEFEDPEPSEYTSQVSESQELKELETAEILVSDAILQALQDIEVENETQVGDLVELEPKSDRKRLAKQESMMVQIDPTDEPEEFMLEVQEVQPEDEILSCNEDQISCNSFQSETEVAPHKSSLPDSLSHELQENHNILDNNLEMNLQDRENLNFEPIELDGVTESNVGTEVYENKDLDSILEDVENLPELVAQDDSSVTISNTISNSASPELRLETRMENLPESDSIATTTSFTGSISLASDRKTPERKSPEKELKTLENSTHEPVTETPKNDTSSQDGSETSSTKSKPKNKNCAKFNLSKNKGFVYYERTKSRGPNCLANLKTKINTRQEIEQARKQTQKMSFEELSDLHKKMRISRENNFKELVFSGMNFEKTAGFASVEAKICKTNSKSTLSRPYNLNSFKTTANNQKVEIGEGMEELD